MENVERIAAYLASIGAHDARRWPDHRGKYWAKCPLHNSAEFRPILGQMGYNCFVCGGKTRDMLLAMPAFYQPDGQAAAPEVPKAEHTPKYVNWRTERPDLLYEYSHHPLRYKMWAEYSRLFTAEIVDRWMLGFGDLPSCKAGENRIIIPTENSYNGRSTPLTPEGEKWLMPYGSQARIFNVPRSADGKVLVLAESRADAILATEYTVPGIDEPSIGLAGSVSGIRYWMELLPIFRAAKRVVVAFDNDHAGCPNEWAIKLARKRYPKIVTYNGYRLLEKLKKNGVNAERYLWPRLTPYGYDIRKLLEREYAGAS